MGKKSKLSVNSDSISTENMMQNSDEDQQDAEDYKERAASKEQQDSASDNEASDPKQKKKKKKFTSVFNDAFLAQTENFNIKLKKRGVIYVARVPPRMTPTKIKNLMQEFGEVTRVYLMQEDKAARQRRKKQGGSGSKRYTEGWVEFAKKSVAKHVAASLNNTQITNYKRSSHYGDLWNLKYLPKFKWSHLTEKVAYERRVQEQKLRVEMMQARRENASYVELVETGKKLDKIEERKRKRGEDLGVQDNNKPRRIRRQNKPVDDQADSASKKALLQSLV